ncbi:MAG: class I SAM-dependent RNA methyltransferase [Corallococcus sp.]|nr:class I SAM-dependent RNA methyltransferase [Corallococcus sp.]
MDLLIPAAFGLEAVVKRQLDKLGYADAKARNGRVRVCNCTWRDVALINMFIRSGERVLINAAEFEADTFDKLYEGIRSVEWRHYLVPDSKVKVVTKTVRSKLFAHNAVQSIGKKAIVDAMYSAFKVSADETGAETVVEIDLTDDVASINLDTSGTGLHKRGYRDLAYSAPLKETTAAALIDLSYYRADKQFADLFCGSGTLPIECALRELNIAAGINRTFAYVNWKCTPKGIYNEVIEQAKDSVIKQPLEILGSDISENAVSIAKHHAKRAGVDKYVKFRVAAAEDFRSESSFGVVISNPPYGERLGDDKQAVEIAKSMGKLYKTLDEWNFYFISPLDGFERCFGRRADKKRRIFNAGIECTYFSFCGKPPKDFD